jgi:hypothetical protein
MNLKFGMNAAKTERLDEYRTIWSKYTAIMKQFRHKLQCFPSSFTDIKCIKLPRSSEISYTALVPVVCCNIGNLFPHHEIPQ